MEDQAILDFGSSVHVNDELRRSIVSETEDLQQDIHKFKDAIASESKINQQLLKDKSHATAETQDLHRSSKEVHDRLTMLHSKFFPELQRTLQQLTSDEDKLVGTNVGTADGDYAMRDADATDENETLPAAEEAEEREVHPHSVKEIARIGKDLSEKLEMLKSYLDEVQDATDSIRIRRTQVVAQQQGVAQKVQELQSELSTSQETTQNYLEKQQKEDELRRSLEIKVRDLQAEYKEIRAATEEKVRPCHGE